MDRWILAFLCILFCGSQISGQAWYDSSAVLPKPCHDVVKKMTSCCNAPLPLISEDIIQECRSVTAPDLTSTTSKGAKKSKNTYDRRVCITECAFAKLQFALNTTKDLAVISYNFQAQVPQVWRPIVVQAIENCSTELVAYNQLSTYLPPQSINSACNNSADLFMTCIKRQFFLACPSNYKLKTEASCPALMDSLRVCDPMADSVPPNSAPAENQFIPISDPSMFSPEPTGQEKLDTIFIPFLKKPTEVEGEEEESEPETTRKEPEVTTKLSEMTSKTTEPPKSTKRKSSKGKKKN